LNGASSSSSCFTGATRGFKGVATSSAMTSSHLHQQKTKKVVETMCICIQKGSRLFILQIRVGEGVGVMAEPHGNSNILDLMDSSNPNFDGGSRSMWGFFVM
jgi:hypothetical protein